MQRADLEHIIRAAGAIAEVDSLVIVGSQALLGRHPDAPPELLRSVEADIFPRDEPDKADLIDGSIGEGSPFHEQFGYYAHGVGPETAQLPANWESRLIAVDNANTRGVTGWCLHPADLLVSKLLAGREKDLAFVASVIRHRLARVDEVEVLCSELATDEADVVRGRLALCAAQRAPRL